MRRLEATSSQSGCLEPELPPYFGGAYVEDGKLLVYLVTKEDLALAKKDLANKIDTTNVVFKNCVDSYQSLLDLTQRLKKFFYEEGYRSKDLQKQ